MRTDKTNPSHQASSPSETQTESDRHNQEAKEGHLGRFSVSSQLDRQDSGIFEERKASDNMPSSTEKQRACEPATSTRSVTTVNQEDSGAESLIDSDTDDPSPQSSFAKEVAEN